MKTEIEIEIEIDNEIINDNKEKGVIGEKTENGQVDDFCSENNKESFSCDLSNDNNENDKEYYYDVESVNKAKEIGKNDIIMAAFQSFILFFQPSNPYFHRN